MFYLQSIFSFTSDLRDEIIYKYKSVLLEGLLRVDPGIADVKDSDWSLLHLAVAFNRPSCAEVLLKFAPHLFDIVDEDNYTPLQHAKEHRPNSIEAIKVLEDHLKNR